MAVYADSIDLIDVGAYLKGSNPLVDRAVQLNTPIKNFLKQRVDERYAFDEVVDQLKTLFEVQQFGN